MSIPFFCDEEGYPSGEETKGVACILLCFYLPAVLLLCSVIIHKCSQVGYCIQYIGLWNDWSLVCLCTVLPAHTARSCCRKWSINVHLSLFATLFGYAGKHYLVHVFLIVLFIHLGISCIWTVQLCDAYNVTYSPGTDDVVSSWNYKKREIGKALNLLCELQIALDLGR